MPEKPHVDAPHVSSCLPYRNNGTFMHFLVCSFLPFATAKSIRVGAVWKLAKKHEKCGERLLIGSPRARRDRGGILPSFRGTMDKFQHSYFGGVFNRGFFARPVVRSEEENYRYLYALDR